MLYHWYIIYDKLLKFSFELGLIHSSNWKSDWVQLNIFWNLKIAESHFDKYHKLEDMYPFVCRQRNHG